MLNTSRLIRLDSLKWLHRRDWSLCSFCCLFIAGLGTHWPLVSLRQSHCIFSVSRFALSLERRVRPWSVISWWILGFPSFSSRVVCCPYCCADVNCQPWCWLIGYGHGGTALWSSPSHFFPMYQHVLSHANPDPSALFALFLILFMPCPVTYTVLTIVTASTPSSPCFLDWCCCCHLGCDVSILLHHYKIQWVQIAMMLLL